MTTRYILEEVSTVDNDFSADSRDKGGGRVVTFESNRTLKLHLAIDHIVQIEEARDTKVDTGRGIVTLTSGKRYITRRSAQELCAAIDKATAGA